MKMTPAAARRIYEQHTEYWRKLRPEMRRLRNAYLMRYWQRSLAYDGSLLIETSRAYEMIESYIASLFVRDPAVVVTPDIRGRGDAELTQEVSNVWIEKQRKVIENALRMALIYPAAFVKLCAQTNADVLQRVAAEPVGPWDVIVDDTASTWSGQRYVGHRYYVPIDVAKERFGAKKYAKRSFSRFLDNQGEDDEGDVPVWRRDEDPNPEQIEDYILVVEFYDLVENKLRVWSPDYSEGKEWLFKGVEVEVGVEEGAAETFDEIPFQTQSGRTVLPIIPVYLSEEPDDPLRGYSALRRVYDQVVEINTIRTFQANGIRRAARQWLVQKGVLDPEAMAKIAQGQDGEFVEVELTPGQELGSCMIPLPHTPVPQELQIYEKQVEDDFGRGSIMAPFTRGEATKATATEVSALAAYSASEIGRMARERDAAIAGLAEAYSVMLGVLMGDETEVVRLSNRPQVLNAKDLTGDFGFFAVDSGSTPVAEAVKKQELLNLLPVLQGLGVPNALLLEKVVRLYDLPEDFLPTGSSTPAAPPVGAPPAPLPTPGQSQAVLPPGVQIQDGG